MYSAAVLTTLFTAVLAVPTEKVARQGGYVSYRGDGSLGAGWPAQSAWATFDAIWSGYQNSGILGSCAPFPGAANDSPTELSDIRNSINSIAGQAGLDARLVLAVVIQESKGCVRAWETQNSVRNPGLMQSYNGPGTCNRSQGQNGVEISHVTPVDPCPQSEIDQMIRDGTLGTAGPGLQQDFAEAGGEPAQAYYRTARIYNSGSGYNRNDLSDGVTATASYASDIANRLRGVVFDQSPFA